MIERFRFLRCTPKELGHTAIAELHAPDKTLADLEAAGVLPTSFYDRMGAGLDPLFEGYMTSGVETAWSPNSATTNVGDVLALPKDLRTLWVQKVLAGDTVSQITQET